MLRIKKELVPLYGGSAGKGVLHTVLCDAKGYDELIRHIDKHDMITSETEPYPPFLSFSGLAYQRNHVDGHDDWWAIFPDHKNSKTILKGMRQQINKHKGCVIKRSSKSNFISINTISHEAFHITRMILNSRGVLFDANNDEPYAYMQGWNTEMIYKNLPKNLIK